MSDIRTISPSISQNSSYSNGNISQGNNSSSMILKGILAVPASSRAISPENSTPNTTRVPSPNSGKKPPPSSSVATPKERTPKKNTKKLRTTPSSHATPPVTPPPSGPLPSTSNSYFASSAFMNSPDPHTIPLPNFDDDNDGDIFEPHHLNAPASPHPHHPLGLQNKTTALLQLLQVK